MGKAPSTRTSHALSRHRPRLLCILAPPPHGKAPPIRNSHAPSKRRPRLLCILASPPNLLIGPASYSAFWSRLLLWSFIMPYTLHFGSASYSAFWPCLLLCILPRPHMWKPLSPEQATPIVRRRLLCNLAPPPHVQLLFDSTRWPASPEVQDRLTGDSDYEYSQSQYPKSWVGKCLILVAQWLQHSACNWDVMSCCPTISWNSYQLALFERQLTVQQSKLWVLLSWVFGSSPVIYLNAVCLGGFRTHYGALVCSDILRVLVNPIMIIFRH